MRAKLSKRAENIDVFLTFVPPPPLQSEKWMDAPDWASIVFSDLCIA